MKYVEIVPGEKNAFFSKKRDYNLLLLLIKIFLIFLTKYTTKFFIICGVEI